MAGVPLSAKGPKAAMVELDHLAGYHLYHATRDRTARTADLRTLELTANPAEQAVLQQRLTWT